MLLTELERPNDTHEALWACIARGADMARARGETAEWYVVQVKEAWDRAITTRGGAGDAFVQRLKQDIVTRAIKAYYMQ